MRIISGTHRGRAIIPPKFFKARPTTDIAKESLFNILQNRIDFDGIAVLDLFSGTGSISYEFASRGAEKVISIDANYRYSTFIKETATKLGLNSIRAIKSDSFRFLKSSHEQFDVVFADPPYDLENLHEIPNLFFQKECLKEDGIFILEHSSNNNFAPHPRFIELRKYGRVHFSLFQ